MTNVEVLENNGYYGDVKEFVENNYPEVDADEKINEMSREQLFDAWLRWNGMYGYTSQIIGLMTTLVNSDEQFSELFEVDFEECKCDGTFVDC